MEEKEWWKDSIEWENPIKSQTRKPYLADEIFLTGTAAEITPIIWLDHKKIRNGKVGKITKELLSEYSDIVMDRNDNFSHWLTPVY